MDSSMWISRLEAAKRQLSLQLQQHGRSDRLGIDEFEVDEEVGLDVPCPYCYEDHDLASLCCHLDEEHPFESKAAVCPICYMKVSKDMLNHIIVQHGHLLKRRRPLGSFTISGSQALSLDRRDLRETHLQMLLGNGAYRSRQSISHTAAESFLSSLVLDFPAQEEEQNSESSISIGDDSSSKKEFTSPVLNSSFDSSLTLEEREQRRKCAAIRATFVQDLLLSTIFKD